MFEAEIECVYCAVRTESLHMIQVKLSLNRFNQFFFNFGRTFRLQLQDKSLLCVWGQRFPQKPRGVISHNTANFSLPAVRTKILSLVSPPMTLTSHNPPPCPLMTRHKVGHSTPFRALVSV